MPKHCKPVPVACLPPSTLSSFPNDFFSCELQRVVTWLLLSLRRTKRCNLTLQPPTSIQIRAGFQTGVTPMPVFEFKYTKFPKVEMNQNIKLILVVVERIVGSLLKICKLNFFFVYAAVQHYQGSSFAHADLGDSFPYKATHHRNFFLWLWEVLNLTRTIQFCRPCRQK